MKKELTFSRNGMLLLLVFASAILFSCSYHGKMRFVRVKKEKHQERGELNQMPESSEISFSAIEEKKPTTKSRQPPSTL